MKSFWQGKKVFITGPATFLGSWLCLTLQELGAQVSGFNESAVTTAKSPNLFELANIGAKGNFTWGSFQDVESVKAALHYSEAEILIHCQDLESKSPLSSFISSVASTGALLEALRETATVRAAVVLSSDKVYARHQGVITEDMPVAAGGVSSTAKLVSELMALSYKQNFFSPSKFNKHKVALATARLGSAIGGGDFSEGSLLFQACEHFAQGRPFTLKKPHSMRSWIHVLDQVNGVLLLAEGLIDKGPKLDDTYNIVSSETAAVSDVASKLASLWGAGVSIVSDPSNHSNLSHHPVLDASRMLEALAWKPHWGLEQSLSKAVRWYQAHYAGQTLVTELCQRDIQSFLENLK
jgi:Nucleoside-diphosphate-sugar epimerases